MWGHMGWGQGGVVYSRVRQGAVELGLGQGDFGWVGTGDVVLWGRVGGAGWGPGRAEPDGGEGRA